MDYNNNYKDEPASYTYLLEKLEISIDEFNKSFDNENIDAHSQIKYAQLYANRLSILISKLRGNKNLDFLDCGCGLGFIPRELKKLGNYNINYCDPSSSVKKIHEKVFPKENFFQSDVENLQNHKKKFDIIYLREVYPFTRNSNYENQNKLIKILNNQLNKNGLIIFEQIKNKSDLFDNLKTLNINHKIIPLLPVKFGERKNLNKVFFESFILQLLLKIIYKILRKKINHFILISKF